MTSIQPSPGRSSIRGACDFLSGIAQAFYDLQGTRLIEGVLAMQAGYFGQAGPKPEMRVALIEVRGLLQARSQGADSNEQFAHLLC